MPGVQQVSRALTTLIVVREVEGVPEKRFDLQASDSTSDTAHLPWAARHDFMHDTAPVVFNPRKYIALGVGVGPKDPPSCQHHYGRFRSKVAGGTRYRGDALEDSPRQHLVDEYSERPPVNRASMAFALAVTAPEMASKNTIRSSGHGVLVEIIRNGFSKSGTLSFTASAMCRGGATATECHPRTRG